MSDIISNSEKQIASAASPVGLRSPSKAADAAEQIATQPNPEVKQSRRRRRFTASYKLRVLEELDRCTIVGEKGAMIRREGLYSSHIAEWRRQRDEGALTALNKVRGRKKRYDLKDQRITALEKEIDGLKNKLMQAETIIDVQKKISEIFGISNPIKRNSENK